MNRPKRDIKKTIKVIENEEQTKQPKNKHQVKKQQIKEKLDKRIEKQKDINEELIQKEVDDSNIVITRDDNDKIYKDLHYINDDINKETKKLIDGFNETFLPELWRGLVPLYVPKKETPIKTIVLLSKLLNGSYHNARSKSDRNIANVIKSVLRNFPYFKNYKEDDLTYIIKNHRYYLLDLLKYAYDKNLSIPTIKNYLNALMRIMFIAYTNAKNQPEYIKYATLAFSLGKRQIEIDDDNTFNSNELTRYLDWEIILKKQEDLKKQFDNISNKQTKEAYNINLDLILLSLYTLRPPLRREIFRLEFKKNSDDKTKDYIYFKRDKVILDLNLEKKRHSAIEFETDDKLADILKQSYKLYPRQYLFTDYRKFPNYDNKLGLEAVGDRLKRMFRNYGVNIGPSILRASYISYLFKKQPHMSMTVIKKISNLMRSSPQYILTSYKKIETETAIIANKDEINIKQEQEQEPTEDILKDNVNRSKKDIVINTETTYKKHIQKMNEKYEKDEEYRKKKIENAKQYRAKTDKTKLQRTKLISMLRSSPDYRNKIKNTTLEKYNIDLNDILQK